MVMVSDSETDVSTWAGLLPPQASALVGGWYSPTLSLKKCWVFLGLEEKAYVVCLF